MSSAGIWTRTTVPDKLQFWPHGKWGVSPKMITVPPWTRAPDFMATRPKVVAPLHFKLKVSTKKKVRQDSTSGGPWMTVRISMSIHPILVELFQSGSKMLDPECSISIRHGTKWHGWHSFSKFYESPVWFPYRLSYKWTKSNDRMEITVKKIHPEFCNNAHVNALCCTWWFHFGILDSSAQL